MSRDRAELPLNLRSGLRNQRPDFLLSKHGCCCIQCIQFTFFKNGRNVFLKERSITLEMWWLTEMWWPLHGRAPDYWGSGPGFESGIFHSGKTLRTGFVIVIFKNLRNSAFHVVKIQKIRCTSMQQGLTYKSCTVFV